MIAFLTLCYSAIVWLVFFKLKLLPWNRTTQGTVVGVGVAALLVLVVSMNLFQPYSTDVRLYQSVVQIVPRVTGRVIDLSVEAHVPVEKGNLLFEIDPEPFQLEVNRLEAALRLAKVIRDDAKALTAASAAAEIRLDKAQAEYDQLLAQLGEARVDLRETKVYAPADGIVTNLALRPGQIASVMASMPVMTFIETSDPILIASFAQAAFEYIRVDDEVEVALNRLPGRILTGRVKDIVPATGQGQLPPSGTLMQWTDQPAPGRFALRLELEEDLRTQGVQGGASGVVAVYTSRGKPIRIIRKVVIRMTSWLNYVFM